MLIMVKHAKGSKVTFSSEYQSKGKRKSEHFLRVNLRRNGSHVLHAKLYLISQHFGQKCNNNKDIFISKDKDI